MNKKISLGAAIAFMAIVAAATLSITMMMARRSYNSKMNDLLNREERYSQIAQIDKLVRDNYAGAISQEDVMTAMARGYVEGTGDPYAEYYDAAQYARLMSENEGKAVQIGIVTAMDESGYIKITEVYPDSPAQAAGIEATDLIVKVDDLDVTSETYLEAVEKLRGEPGTKMSIIVRRGVDETTMEMTRRFVEPPSLSSTMLANSIGLVTIRSFGTSAPEQFIKQVDGLIDQGALGLVFDVRNVTEGTLASVTGVLDKLLPSGVIISSVDKNGTITELARSDPREVALPMVVLVNEKTTAEAEVFAAAMRDYDKGRLVGMKTAGKGTIQRLLPLGDGSGAVRLTTGIYRTPLGSSFDKDGLKPDFEVRLSDDQISLMQAGDAESDLQMKKAMEVVGTQMKAAGLVSTEQPPASQSEMTQSASSQPVTSQPEPASSEEEEISSGQSQSE